MKVRTNQCGRPAECADCAEVKPIRGHGLCARCYHRWWSRERRRVAKLAPKQPQYKPYGVAPYTGWGYRPYWEAF